LAFTSYDSGEGPDDACDVGNVWSIVTVCGTNIRNTMMSEQEWAQVCIGLMVLAAGIHYVIEYGIVVLSTQF